ncbi:signal recognition particle-docking protein FtsY [Colwellia sp. E150_009]
MSKKKKGMFSWLGFGQDKKDQVIEDENTSPEQVSNDQAQESINEGSISEPIVNDVVAEADIQDPETTATLAQETEQASTPMSEPTSESALDHELSTLDESASDDAELAQNTSIATEQNPEPTLTEVLEAELKTTAEPVKQPEKPKETKLGFFARLKQGLSKTRLNLGGGLFDLFKGKQIDDELFEELETHLLLADVGVETTMKIIDSLTKSANRKQLKDAEALYELLKIELKKVIENVSQPLEIPESDEPFVMLMVGVNGVGKTTTIGKLAKQFQAEGKSVMLAAGDTFRAAAVEQLQVWGERNDIPVIAQHTGADSASVIFDAISAAKARKVDIIIADTAGRLQNKAHLMEELKKVVRVMKKLDVNAPHEVMLTLDAGTGQNALSQTKLFDEAVGLTGLTVTKLDGTAKGGVVFAIADKYNIPIRYLGVGEGIDDLRPFNGDDFIDALFAKE